LIVGIVALVIAIAKPRRNWRRGSATRKIRGLKQAQEKTDQKIAVLQAKLKAKKNKR
jgi:hypothetical protein